MKNFLLAVLGLFAALPYAPCLRAEVIDSVSFNPSRLGRYEQLKLTDGLSSQGGVNTQYMTVQSGGTVSVSNAGDYELTRSDVSGSVNMPGTRFETPDVVMKGGKGVFEQRDKSSLIKTLTSNALKIKADVLEAGTVNVKGDVHNKDYDEQDINVFKLGNNNIPKADASCARMEWVERTASDGKKYKVLAMTGCGKRDLYGPDINEYAYVKDTCPGANESARYTCTDDKTKCVDVIQNYGWRWVLWGGTPWSTTDTCDEDEYRNVEAYANPSPQEQRIECTDFYPSVSASVGSVQTVQWRCDNTARCLNHQAHDTAGNFITPGLWCGNVVCENISGIYCGYAQGVGLPSNTKRVLRGSYLSDTELKNMANQACSDCRPPDCRTVLLQDREPECKYDGIGPGTAYYQTFKMVLVDCGDIKRDNKKWIKEVTYRKVDCTGGGDIEGHVTNNMFPPFVSPIPGA